MPPFELVKIVIVLGAALLLAVVLAQIVRLPQFTRRIALVLVAIALPAVALFPWEDAMRKGIDLSGGTILVYQVEKESAKSADFNIEKMVAALSRRINPSGVREVTIRAIGENRVEIIIPRAAQQEVERCKRILTTVGSLEFRILANERDHAGLIAQGKASFPRPVMRDGKTLARWVPVAKDATREMTPHGQVAIQADDKGQLYVLVDQDPFNVTGEYLQRAEPTNDERGRLAVGFHFNSKGANLFGTLTAKNMPAEDGFERRLAIILNGEIYSAPNLHDQISSNGIISGSFTQETVKDLVNVLNAGSLPGVLEKIPASELTIGPTLGADTIRSGLMAMALASALVLVFMVIYYRLAGVIADIAVILNVLIVVGCMAWVHATWTLAGLAGLALTVGMAVDANVLIYERLREEQERGRSLRMTIEYAFNRALSPILDSNITTLLSGVVLYAIGSEQVKGFAVTLIIGLLANLFTAVFVCRVLFDILERNNWITRVGMLKWMGKPNFDFVGKRWYAVAGSSVLILIGMVALAVRGSDVLDIDFTGGTLAAVRFEKQTDSATVRTLAENAGLEGASVEELQLHDEPAGHRFLIRTTLPNPEEVKAMIAKGFGNQLANATMTHGAITEIPKPDAAKPAAEKPEGSKEAAEKPAAADTKANAEPAIASNPFAGGHRTELEFNSPVAMESLQSVLEAAMAAQNIPDPAMRFNLTPLGEPAKQGGYAKAQLETDLDQAALEKLLPDTAARLADQSMFERLENFGGQVAKEMQTAAIIAVILSMLVIVGYLWIRFQNVRYGLGAIVAVIHDVLVALGLVALSKWVAGTFVGNALMVEDFKINLPMIAAFLTLVGYSVNDTIVIFDRIREVKGKRKEITWELINDSVNQTLSRTLLTSLTVWMVVLILYTMGGSAIHGFSFCLLVGLISGTYSTIYIASPVLMWFGSATEQKRANGRQTSSESDTSDSGEDSDASGRGRRKRRVPE
jgi:SecD/SecF fusion protein